MARSEGGDSCSPLCSSAPRLPGAGGPSVQSGCCAECSEVHTSREGTMAAKENVETMREIFRAIEDRDLARLVALTDPAAEFHWPPSLPYGGISPLQPAAAPPWAQPWTPPPPTNADHPTH